MQTTLLSWLPVFHPNQVKTGRSTRRSGSLEAFCSQRCRQARNVKMRGKAWREHWQRNCVARERPFPVPSMTAPGGAFKRQRRTRGPSRLVWQHNLD